MSRLLWRKCWQPIKQPAKLRAIPVVAAGGVAARSALVGSSGIVFGLAAASLWLELFCTERLPAWLRIPRRSMYFFLGVNGALMLAVPFVSASAHIGGFLGGFLGTAMVTGASFVLIVNSYSSLGIGIGQTIWIMLFSFLASMVVGPFPGIGIIVALSMLSSGFTSGYEEGYLILKPIVPVLMGFAVTIDVLTALLGTMLTARQLGVQSEIEARDQA